VVKTYPFELLTYPYGNDPTSFDPGRCAEIYDSHFNIWIECKDLGYDGVFFSEHHFTAYNPSPSPNLLVAALAKPTSRMRLGVMCNVLPFHNPLRLAEETAMLDYLTGGRLEVGFGRGADAYEFEKMGIPHEETRGMFE
jgi:alkanesulfonate monooxygenase SsuD/methylene tetrahydromethanopterin reductase-like flavin-dependent oxidoreductase (luciferase family)